MNTDTPFYRLFQERPATVFELAGLPEPEDSATYRYSGEIRQTALRPKPQSGAALGQKSSSRISASP